MVFSHLRFREDKKSKLMSLLLFTLQVAILLFVLLLWAGAISLFYHQWGKIRGIDDYQPDYVHANMTIHPNPFPDDGSEIGVSK